MGKKIPQQIGKQFDEIVWPKLDPGIKAQYERYDLEIILGGIIIQKIIGLTIKEILIYTIIHFQNGVQSKIG